jgi:hypothetical protein
LASATVICTLGSTTPLFWAESDVSNLTRDVFARHLSHISWEGMLINLHRLLSFGRSFKFKPPLLNSWSDLLFEDLAIIDVVRCCIVPLAILHPLQLFCIWYGMELREFNLPMLKQ